MTNFGKIPIVMLLSTILVGMVLANVGLLPAYALPASKYGVMTSGSSAGGFANPAVGSTITGSAATNDPSVTKVKFQWLDPGGSVVQMVTDLTSTPAGGSECMTTATKYTGGVRSSDVAAGGGFICFSDAFTIPGPVGDWAMKAAFCTTSQTCSPPHIVNQRAISFVAEEGAPSTGCAAAIVDICIDVDGIATPLSGVGVAANEQVFVGAVLSTWPSLFGAPGTPPFPEGLDMFDNDANLAWTFGAAGDDLHLEDPTGACSTAIRDAFHNFGFDCVVLDLDGSFATFVVPPGFAGQPVSCDFEGAFAFPSPPAVGGCPPFLGPNSVKFFDFNGDGVYKNGEDIVLDVNGDGIFN